MGERFEHRPMEFVGVTCPNLVYVGVASRLDFDRIAAPLHDSGENSDGHVLVKRAGDFSANGVTVVFQYWVKSLTVEALIENNAARRAKAEGDTP